MSPAPPNPFPISKLIRPSRRRPPSYHLDSQDQQPVALLAIVAIGLPGFDLQPLGIGALGAIQRFQQARGAQVHRVEGTQLQAENLAILLVVLCLQRVGQMRGQRAAPAIPRALLPLPASPGTGAAAARTPERTVRPRRAPWRGFGVPGTEGRGDWGATRRLPECGAVS